MRRIVSVVAVAAACAAVALGATPTPFQPVWPAKQLNAALTAPWMAPNSDTLLVGSADGSVQAYNAGTGALEWRAQVPAAAIACTPIELSTGDVLAVTPDGDLYSVTPTSSATPPAVMRLFLNDRFSNCTPVADAASGLVAVASRYSNTLYVINPKTWDLVASNTGASTARFGPNGLIWVGARNGYLDAYNYSAAGTTPSATNPFYYSGPTSAAFNRPALLGVRVFFTSKDGLYVVNVDTGRRVDTVGPSATLSDAVLLPNNLLVYGSDSAGLVFAAPADTVPQIVQAVELPSTAPVDSTPAVVGGAAVVVTADGGVFAVPLAPPQPNGNRTVVQASYLEHGPAAYSTPAVSTKYGAVYVTTTVGGLHALRVQSATSAPLPTLAPGQSVGLNTCNAARCASNCIQETLGLGCFATSQTTSVSRACGIAAGTKTLSVANFDVLGCNGAATRNTTYAVGRCYAGESGLDSFEVTQCGN